MNRFKTILPLLLLLAGLNTVEAFQQDPTDSLMQVLEGDIHDTIRVQTLASLARSNWNSNPQGAEDYAREGVRISQEIGYRKGEAMSYYQLSITFWTRSIYDKAIEYALECLKISEELGLEDDVVKTKNLIGLTYHRQGRYEEALGYYLREYEYWKAKNDSFPLINTTNAIGTAYLGLRRYNDALKFFQESSMYNSAVGNEINISTIDYNLAEVYGHLYQHQKAISMYQSSLVVAQKFNLTRNYSNIYHRLGTQYAALRNYSRAITNLNEGLKFAMERGDIHTIARINRSLSDTYGSISQHARALSHYKEFLHYNDSVYSVDQVREINSLESAYQLKKKNQEIEIQTQKAGILENDRKIRRTWNTILALAISLLIVTGGIGFYGNVQRNKKQQLLSEEKEALAQAELETINEQELVISKELELRTNALEDYAKNFALKGEFIANARTRLESIAQSFDSSEFKKKLQSLVRLLDQSKILDKDWEEFRTYFEEVHNEFFTRLTGDYPDLSSTELKLCALSKLNLNLQETANLMAISVGSVKTSRNRLRKKLSLTPEQKLHEYLATY